MMARLILFTLVFVSGCVSYTPQKTLPPESGELYSSPRTDLKQWRIAAKLSIKTSDGGFAGRIDWTQKESSYRILISGPLGFGQVKIEGNHNSASMRKDDQVLFGSAEMLMLNATSISIPINNLRWWLSGVPSPKGGPANFSDENEDNRTMSFSQDGWYLFFSNYSSTLLGYLPGEIIGQNDKLSFKLIISKWRSPES